MVKKNDDLENNNILKFVIGIYIAKYAALTCILSTFLVPPVSWTSFAIIVA